MKQTWLVLFIIGLLSLLSEQYKLNCIYSEELFIIFNILLIKEIGCLFSNKELLYLIYIKIYT